MTKRSRKQARKPAAMALLAMLLVASPVAAQKSKKRVGGVDVARRTMTVVDARRWSSSFDELKKRAQREKKLIFWLQLVGELGGGL